MRFDPDRIWWPGWRVFAAFWAFADGWDSFSHPWAYIPAFFGCLSILIVAFGVALKSHAKLNEEAE